MPPTRALIACDVFTDEIAAICKESTVTFSAACWLEMGLHDHPARLRTALQSAIESLEFTTTADTVLLAYGRCGDGLVGLRAGRCALVLPRGHDCISVLLGGPAAHEAILKADPGVYFYSPGWIRGRRVPGPDRESHLRAFYAERYPEDAETVNDLIEADRETFAAHGCAAYASLTHDPVAEAYCRTCANHLGWSHRNLRGDPSLLRDLLTGAWDAERFIMIPPGHTIAISASGTLYAAR